MFLSHAILTIAALVINRLIQVLHIAILLAIAVIQAALTAHPLVQVGINFPRRKKTAITGG